MDSIILLGQKNTLAEYMILFSADNQPPMLDKDLTKKYAELSAVEKIKADCDMKVTNIIFQGLPADIYSLVNHHKVSKYLWERVQLLMQDPRVPDGQAIQTIIQNNAAFQTEDLDTYDSDCDDILNAKAVLMANISNYGFDVISEVPHSETYLNDTENQSVHAMQDFEQSPVMDFPDNEINSDSNIIPYS
uniref:Integrase, catalytic region, zinc finger, CCHC-type, peptidase aspartic, catalytic n=1 Tax=Tanacetum cinerariifolium TaxID=118510 RepID=A0A699GNL0_TANCI|nr:hypothetical protein [Tanacetum cinerariifolium]